MAMPWSASVWIARMIWAALGALVVFCLFVADDYAHTLRHSHPDFY